MIGQILLYLGAAFPIIRGIAHFFPTRSVVAGFGDISPDNRHIITMEWISEGVLLVFIGSVIAVITFSGHTAPAAQAIRWLCVIVLNVLSVISRFTGFRIALLPFKLCPVIFTGSSLIIIVGNSL